MEKAPHGVWNLAEKATHEVTHEFRDWCSASQSRERSTTDHHRRAPEFPIIMTESRDESEIDLEEGQATLVVSSEVEQSRVWRRKKRKMWKEFSKRQDMQRSRYVTKSITALKRTRWLQSTVMLSSTPMASQQLERWVL